MKGSFDLRFETLTHSGAHDELISHQVGPRQHKARLGPREAQICTHHNPRKLGSAGGLSVVVVPVVKILLVGYPSVGSRTSRFNHQAIYRQSIMFTRII